MDTGREHSEQQTKQSRWGFRGMTVRDWLQLLIVPFAIVVISFLFTAQQEQRQEQTENERAKAERKLAKERAQDEALQAYLDQMNNLLLERNLRESAKDSEARTLARARTLTVLSTLDPSGKTAIMQFLVEADLVQRVDGRDPIISLRGADLSGANLSNRIYPSGADLRGAFLRNADLRGADLILADLYHAKLKSADLSGAILTVATLSGADLSGADLSGAFLRNADLSGADLHNAYGGSNLNLKRAILSEADLRGAWLSEGDLTLADLSEANLSGTHLREANLREANLREANLRDASLRDAKGLTEEQLRAASSLKGAIMPNGQKYEDWLKDKERSKEDEQDG